MLCSFEFISEIGIESIEEYGVLCYGDLRSQQVVIAVHMNVRAFSHCQYQTWNIAYLRREFQDCSKDFSNLSIVLWHENEDWFERKLLDCWLHSLSSKVSVDLVQVSWCAIVLYGQFWIFARDFNYLENLKQCYAGRHFDNWHPICEEHLVMVMAWANMGIFALL